MRAEEFLGKSPAMSADDFLGKPKKSFTDTALDYAKKGAGYLEAWPAITTQLLQGAISPVNRVVSSIMGATPEESSDFANYIAEQKTYEPITEEGKWLTKKAMWPIEKAGQLIIPISKTVGQLVNQSPLGSIPYIKNVAPVVSEEAANLYLFGKGAQGIAKPVKAVRSGLKEIGGMEDVLTPSEAPPIKERPLTALEKQGEIDAARRRGTEAAKAETARMNAERFLDEEPFTATDIGVEQTKPTRGEVFESAAEKQMDEAAGDVNKVSDSELKTLIKDEKAAQAGVELADQPRDVVSAEQRAYNKSKLREETAKLVTDAEQEALNMGTEVPQKTGASATNQSKPHVSEMVPGESKPRVDSPAKFTTIANEWQKRMAVANIKGEKVDPVKLMEEVKAEYENGAIKQGTGTAEPPQKMAAKVPEEPTLMHANPIIPIVKGAFNKIKGYFDDMDIKLLGKTPEETLGHAVRRVGQDKYIALKEWEKRLEEKWGIKLNKEESAYFTEERSHGIISDKINAFDRDIVKPFIDAVVDVQKKHGLTLEDLDNYLKAKDAPNRNRIIQERNAERLVNAKTPQEQAAIQALGSGMTDAEAAAMLAKYKGKEAVLDDLAKVVYEVNKKRLDMIEQFGLETPKTIAQMRATFGETYIPWKGKADLRSGQNVGTGKGISVKNSGIKQALGRTSTAENAIVHSFEDLKDTIARVQRNEIGKAFLDLVEKYPDPSIEVNRPKLDQRLNAETGQVETFNKPVWANGEPLDPFADNVVSVMKDGKHYFIRVNDNPLLARALTQSYNKPAAIDHVIGAIGGLTRNIAAIYTKYSPSFAVTNPVRDFFDAIQGIGVEHKASMAARAAKLIPSSMKDMYIYNKTGGGNPYAVEFAQSGGMTGFYSGKDFKLAAKYLQKEINRETATGLKGASWRTLGKVGDMLSDLTSSTENATRLAAYQTLRENGFSVADASSYAKNVTVNFNRGGEWKWINQLYMFSNPAIQGIQRFGKLAGSQKGQWTLAGITSLALALNEYNRYVAGDDGAGINNYDHLSSTEKSRYIIIMNPQGGDQPLVKIPLGFFQRVPFAIANGVSEVGHKTKEPTKAGMDILESLLDAFNPIGGSQLSTTAVPSAVKPIVELYANKNWQGKPIYPEQMPWDVRPNSQMAFQGVSPFSKTIAEKANELTGGDEMTPGKIDITPEAIDHVTQFFTGTLGKDIYKIIDLGMRNFDEMRPLKDIKPSDLPIAGRFTGSNTEFFTYSKFREVAVEADRMAQKAKLWEEKDDPRFDVLIDKNIDMIELGEEVRSIQKELSGLNHEIKEIKEDGTLAAKDKLAMIEEIKQEKETIMKDFISEYLKIKTGGTK